MKRTFVIMWNADKIQQLDADEVLIMLTTPQHCKDSYWRFSVKEIPNKDIGYHDVEEFYKPKDQWCECSISITAYVECKKCGKLVAPSRMNKPQPKLIREVPKELSNRSVNEVTMRDIVVNRFVLNDLIKTIREIQRFLNKEG